MLIFDEKKYAKNLLKKKENGYFIDFGFEAVGYLKYSASGKSGDTIWLDCKGLH